MSTPGRTSTAQPTTPSSGLGSMGRWEKQRAVLQENNGPSASAASPLSAKKKKTPTWKSPSAAPGDRFIPNRAAMDMDLARFSLTAAVPSGEQQQQQLGERESSAAAEASAIYSPSKEQYKKQLETFLREDSTSAAAASSSANSAAAAGTKILAFKSKPPAPPEGHENPHRVLYSQSGNGPAPSRKGFRNVPQAPEKILDAPELVDDYYLNLLDWSIGNVVAVALGPSVYLWDAATGGIEELGGHSREEGGHVTSIAWAPDGKHLAVGTSGSEVLLWDTARLRLVRTMRGHSARVSSLAWNGATLSTAGRDTVILNHDVRVREHVTSRLHGHEQEVCGLKWSPSGTQLASGGNDNLLHIWDSASLSGQRGGGGPMGLSGAGSAPSYLHRLDAHQAAVKALAWCPFQSNLLASGGGTADRCIKFWNTHTGACLNSVDTHSQVCALQWSKHERELLSSHGYSQNQLCLWKYPSMVKVAELTGHTARVLHMAQSPDGCLVASAAADETLRFWRAFGPAEGGAAAGAGAVAGGAAVKQLALAGGGKLGGGNGRLRSINIR